MIKVGRRGEKNPRNIELPCRRRICQLHSDLSLSRLPHQLQSSRSAPATAAMGTLKDVWRNPHLDIYNKYLHFRSIPMNLLLWGAEMWSLRKTQLDQLEVFFHRSIRCILQISMSTVKEERIRNERVREMFYLIPCIRNMITSRQADFIGKMIRGPPDRPS